MPVTITSGGVQAVCAVLVIIGGFSVFVIDALIAKHIRNINGTYIKSAGSTITGREIERRLDANEDQLTEVHKYAHQRAHELANAMQRMHSGD